MTLSELKQLQRFLENRQPLLDDFATVIAASHKEPWPGFVIIGLSQHINKGVLKPAVKGVPEGRVQYDVGVGPPWRTVVELAARVTAVRSRRWYPITQTVKPISPKWQQLCREAFPFLCSMKIADGWSDLMIAASGWIAEIGVPPGFMSSQIKEKYATLRWYYSGPDDGISDIIEAAEWLSAHICETCGRPGKLRDGSYFKTLCDWHA